MTDSYKDILIKELPDSLNEGKCIRFFKQQQRYFSIYKNFDQYENYNDFLNALTYEDSTNTSWLSLFEKLEDFDSILNFVSNINYDEDIYQKEHPNIFDRKNIIRISDLFLEKLLNQKSLKKSNIQPKTLSLLKELSRYFVFSAIQCSDEGVINKEIEKIFNGQTYSEFSLNLIEATENKFKSSLDVARGEYLSSDINHKYKKMILSNVDRAHFFKLVEKNTDINHHDRINEKIVFALFPKVDIYNFVDEFLNQYPNLNTDLYREGLNDIIFEYLFLNIGVHFLGFEFLNYD